MPATGAAVAATTTVEEGTTTVRPGGGTPFATGLCAVSRSEDSGDQTGIHGGSQVTRTSSASDTLQPERAAAHVDARNLALELAGLVPGSSLDAMAAGLVRRNGQRGPVSWCGLGPSAGAGGVVGAGVVPDHRHRPAAPRATADIRACLALVGFPGRSRGRPRRRARRAGLRRRISPARLGDCVPSWLAV